MAENRVPDMPEREVKPAERKIKRIPTRQPAQAGIQMQREQPSPERPFQNVLPPDNNRPQQNTGGNVGARMNINDQTPSKRRSAKEAKRINPDAPEISRSAKRAQGYKIKKKKRGISKQMLAYAVLFLLVFSAVVGLFSLAFYMNLVETDPPVYDGMRLKLCLEHEVSDTKAMIVDTSKYVHNGELYVNMTAISEKFGFIMTGDRKMLRFITNEKTAETVCFEIGSPFAEINGTVVRLSGETVNHNGSLFVPADFFDEYVVGIDVAFDEEKLLLTVLRDTTRNEEGHFDNEEVSFTLKRVDTCPSISEFELPQAIKDKCTFITVLPEVPAET